MYAPAACVQARFKEQSDTYEISPGVSRGFLFVKYPSLLLNFYSVYDILNMFGNSSGLILNNENNRGKE